MSTLERIGTERIARLFSRPAALAAHATSRTWINRNGDPLMDNKLKTLALGAAFAIGVSGAAFAQTCPAGYYWSGGACYPGGGYGAYAPNNPVSGAAAGANAGAAQGAAAAGPVGAIVGGALGTAGGALAGTTNMVTGAPVAPVYGSSTPPATYGPCPPGQVLYQGYCYWQ
ncbi:MAG: hypothetical protein AB7H71_07760 [Alphaproteobacteria bacterium]